MDTRRRFSLFLLLSLIAAVSLITSSTAAEEAEKVRLELYYESLCPYCSNFIVNYLPDLFQNGLISAVDLKLSPYGNAKVSSDGSIVCQHGPKECLLNTIEACAIDAWPDLDTHFKFIYCVESMVFNKNYSQWETCFAKVGLDRKPIDECYKNGRGTQLELGYAQETSALKPPHKYVPWVVVDGTPLEDDYENFVSYICEAYKGSSPPNACNNLPVIKKVQVSHKENFSKRSEVYSSEDDTSTKAEELTRSKMILM